MKHNLTKLLTQGNNSQKDKSIITRIETVLTQEVGKKSQRQKLDRKKEEKECRDELMQLDPMYWERYANPQNAREWFYRGITSNGDRTSIQCYDKSIELDPNDADVWYEKGSSHMHRSEYKEALECYDKALEIKKGCDLLVLQ